MGFITCFLSKIETLGLRGGPDDGSRSRAAASLRTQTHSLCWGDEQTRFQGDTSVLTERPPLALSGVGFGGKSQNCYFE